MTDISAERIDKEFLVISKRKIMPVKLVNTVSRTLRYITMESRIYCDMDYVQFMSPLFGLYRP